MTTPISITPSVEPITVSPAGGVTVGWNCIEAAWISDPAAGMKFAAESKKTSAIKRTAARERCRVFMMGSPDCNTPRFRLYCRQFNSFMYFSLFSLYNARTCLAEGWRVTGLMGERNGKTVRFSF